ncbi:MAG TPA: IS110 family transposase [Polyangia bacterium]|nr:IS110 family transposase [Polyangia bacterium]
MKATIDVGAVIGGVDTHKDTHTVAALDQTGRRLGEATFPATAKGYSALSDWLRRFGDVSVVGVEGTGSYGTGLLRHFQAEAIRVVEVGRPNRQARRRHGKSDGADAVAAARAALNGDHLGAPKSQNGSVEVIRMLRVERRSAIRARTQAANQIHAVVATAPEPLRATLRELTVTALVKRAQRFRVAPPTDVMSATRVVLRGLAQRWVQLDAEVVALDRHLDSLVRAAAPDLVQLRGVGADVAGALLVAAGDNPERLSHESSFAALCGASPLDASSGRQNRHRLNRGGNRDANRALWVIALVRMRSDARTRRYVARRLQEGRTKPEILRCLKRYIAREIFRKLSPSTPSAAAA